MNTLDYFKEHFEEFQSGKGSNGLGQIRQHAFDAFNKLGIPTSRHEEWKYTRIGNVFNTQYQLSVNANKEPIPLPLIQGVRLPGHEKANELFFINGIFSSAHSTVRSGELVVLPLEEAAKNEYGEFVKKYFGCSGQYIKDGINALNTALMNSAVFIHVKKGRLVRHPIYIYNITDASSTNILAQPRCLVHVGENSSAQIVETYATIGSGENFTNQVMEIIVEKDAMLEYYKIQNDAAHANQVSTTHIRQTGKSYVHTVTISLNGAIVRNNMNILMESEYSEAHLYGLYFMQGRSHIDNHTLVDNIKPNCLSNELYKGIMDDTSTGVFNGKVFVRPLAQKTN
ncbi:MAG TPA: SufD family Fe-S cluster assembly protein, partial [Chitinophagaceae bacterium]|nr:SufD family Fe-S cluster assembly protein [Chitinophagaceae bacterium]